MSGTEAAQQRLRAQMSSNTATSSNTGNLHNVSKDGYLSDELLARLERIVKKNGNAFILMCAVLAALSGYGLRRSRLLERFKLKGLSQNVILENAKILLACTGVVVAWRTRSLLQGTQIFISNIFTRPVLNIRVNLLNNC